MLALKLLAVAALTVAVGLISRWLRRRYTAALIDAYHEGRKDERDYWLRYPR